MKLVIDLGNTNQKFYCFDGKRVCCEVQTESIGSKIVLPDRILKCMPFKAAIISSVIDVDASFFENIIHKDSLILFDYNTPVPVINKYKTRETLGLDRLAAVVAGNMLFPGKEVLVIDAGTCIKYDLVVDNEYLGGMISPGLLMQAKALNNFTAKLPLVDPYRNDDIPLIGADTNGSIISGIINATVASMDGIIDEYRDQYAGLKVVISGGDMKYFVNRLKNSIFAHPNIVAVGLNEILDFNENSSPDI